MNNKITKILAGIMSGVMITGLAAFSFPAPVHAMEVIPESAVEAEPAPESAIEAELIPESAVEAEMIPGSVIYEDEIPDSALDPEIMTPSVIDEDVLTASSSTCIELSGNNTEAQDYDRWAKPSGSSLAALSNGRLMSVTHSSDGRIVVMYFDSSYQLAGFKTISPGLPIYGGFFASSDGYYYIATGQNNPNESDSVEVYRITKYDSNWIEISHASLFGANTYVPYDAGSCDFAENDRYLLVRTCHEMYASDDGLHHQACVTIQIDKTNMTVTGSHYWVANISSGYVSHSFNQFIRNDNGYAVAVDHGDAYPRAIVIGKYRDSIGNGIVGNGQWAASYTYTNAITIPGRQGANDTGVSVGGFEISDSAYLIAVNTVNMSGTYDAFGTRNAAIVCVPKTPNGFGTPVTRTLTNYSGGEAGVSTPRLVKLGANSFLMLWSRNGTVYYTKLDGNGNAGSTYSFRGLFQTASLSYITEMLSGMFTMKGKRTSTG